MSDFTRISIAAVVILFLAVGIPWCINNASAGEPVKALESPVSVYPLAINGVDNVGINDNGVVEILVTEHSAYVIDPRFDLCFYETRSAYGSHATKISCEPFERVVSGLRK